MKREKQVKNLQDNLNTIRLIAGWSTTKLGKKIGVTKQTIWNIENPKRENKEKAYEMTLTQYLALRYILDEEVEKNHNAKVLKLAIKILVDNETFESKEDEDLFKEQMKVIAASAEKGVKEESLLQLSSILIGSLPMVAGAVIAALGKPAMGIVVQKDLGPVIKDILKNM